MAKDRERNWKEEGTEEEEEEAPLKKDHGRKPKRRKESESDDDDDEQSSDHRRKHSRSHKKKRRSRSSKRSSRRRYSDDDSSSSSYSSDASDSEMSGSDSESDGSRESDSEDERRRRRKRKEKKRKEREYEKEKRRRRREKEKEKKKLKKEKERKERKKKKELKKGPVTNSWGKYGIIRETDMWNKRPEFTAWLSEIKKVNLETIPNYEEKQMFKEFMEDHNTATFPSKKYYNLDAYHRHKIEKEIKKGVKKLPQAERTIFNDEEQRRLELMQEREKQKEQEVETLKRAMQSGMAQAMKEQAQLREEMAYQYKLGNFEAAAAIQRRLDPDVAM